SFSSAAPPTRPVLMSKRTARFLSNQSMTRVTCENTSGPIPSPGSARTVLLAGMCVLPETSGLGAGVEPGLAGLLLGFEAVDLRLLLQGEADVIEAVEQAVLAERIDVEPDAAAVGPADLLLLEVDGDHRIGAARGVVEQLVDVFLRQLDRQDAVLEAVVIEDVGERGG